MAIIEIDNEMKASIDNEKLMILNNCISLFYNIYVKCQLCFYYNYSKRRIIQ